MSRLRNRRHVIEHDDVHRWLVSYADYMTLLFALFVVLYAMAMVNEKPFEAITESIGKVFQANDERPKNKGQGDDILPVNSSRSQISLYGDGIVEEAGPELLEGKSKHTKIGDSQLGTELSSLEGELHKALYDLEESGYANLQRDGDWLEIELNSGLMFASGSSSLRSSAKLILEVIKNHLDDASNYIRIRGYTDNQPINTEVFPSNWELSVYRATAILHLLEQLTINPARMAIEGYGQYYPSADNNTAQGRAKNRKVVIAISKYALPEVVRLNANEQLTELAEQAAQIAIQAEALTVPNDKIKVIRLPSGGIRITTSEN
jgi:chemotaxis protein MotB